MTNNQFAEHLRAAKDPNRWLEVYGIALEESGGWDVAARIADEICDVPNEQIGGSDGPQEPSETATA